MSVKEVEIGNTRVSETAFVGKIVLGAAAGAVGGLLAGWVGFESPVTAILGLLAGAVSGVLATALSLERD